MFLEKYVIDALNKISQTIRFATLSARWIVAHWDRSFCNRQSFKKGYINTSFSLDLRPTGCDINDPTGLRLPLGVNNTVTGIHRKAVKIEARTFYIESVATVRGCQKGSVGFIESWERSEIRTLHFVINILCCSDKMKNERNSIEKVLRDM
jgi:hypothetical protein